MKLQIDTDILDKEGISIDDFILLLHLYFHNHSINNVNPTLLEENNLSSNGVDFVENILLKCDTTMPLESSIKKLAEELKNIYPKGKKDNMYYWTDGISLIIKRLKIFFKKYGIYSNEIIIDATKRYVDSFNGDYRFMKLLKYFIFKEKKGEGGDVESSSDLLNFIENNEGEESSNDWSTELR